MKKKTNRKVTISEKGQAIIIVIFSIVGLIGSAALAIDGGRAYIEKGKVQSAADAAALSGALARIEQKNWREFALASALANGYDNNGDSNTIELNTPPIDGPHINDPEYIQVIITSKIRTFFGGVIGIPNIVISSRAISQTKPATIGEMFDGYALVSLAPKSSCEPNKKRAFWIEDEALLTLQGGGIFVNSDNPTCAFNQIGNSGIKIIDDSPISVVGGTSIQKPRSISPFPPKTGVPPISFPPPFQMPKIGCGSQIAEVSGGIIGEDGKLMNATLSPGNWGEDFPPEGVTSLEPGIFCIGGDVLVEGLLSGTDVTLIVDYGTIRITSAADVQLSAPGNGLLIYMPLENNNKIALGGNENSEYKGTILAPAADLYINGISSKFGFHSQIIAYYIDVKGIDNIRITYKDEQNFDTLRMPEVRLSD